MSVADAADAPVPQRPASAVVGALLIAAGVSATWIVHALYHGDPRRLQRPSIVLAVAVVSVMLLGAVKRAFRGFDRGTLVAAVVVVGLGRLTWNWVSGEGLTGHLHGAAVAALGIGLGAAVARRPGGPVEPRLQHLRRSAGITGWVALATVAFGAVAPSAAASVFDLGVYWMPFFGAAFGGGACVVAGLALGITTLFRDPWKSGPPSATKRAP